MMMMMMMFQEGEPGAEDAGDLMAEDPLDGTAAAALLDEAMQQQQQEQQMQQPQEEAGLGMGQEDLDDHDADMGGDGGIAHETLNKWAHRYRGIAAMGLLSALLLVGKFSHSVVSSYSTTAPACRLLVLPPVMIAALLGLCAFHVIGDFDPSLQEMLKGGFHHFRQNMECYVFVSLILGFSCSRRSIMMTSGGLFNLLLHEAMPMVIFTQIVVWGQSAVSLCVSAIYRTAHPEISPLIGGIIPLGLEDGRDVIPAQVYGQKWAHEVIEEAENTGLVVVIALGILLMSWRARALQKGWLGKEYARYERHLQQTHPGGASKEHFDRGGVAEVPQSGNSSTTPSAVAVSAAAAAAAAGGGQDFAPLGTHLAFIAVCVFAAFVIELLCRAVELHTELLRSHRFLSGIPLYQLSCGCALGLMHMVLRVNHSIQFNKEWFHRLCGLGLDLMIISAITPIGFYGTPKHASEDMPCDSTIFSAVVIAAVVWNIFTFVVLAPRMFPNFWFCRATALIGESMGHSMIGLLLARTMDPSLLTPVPLAFAYKLLLFMIPGVSGKNTIVISIVDTAGEWPAFFVCVAVIASWMFIFHRYFRHKIQGMDGKTNKMTGSPRAMTSPGTPVSHSGSSNSGYSGSMRKTIGESADSLEETQNLLHAAAAADAAAAMMDVVGGRDSPHSMDAVPETELQLVTMGSSTSTGSGSGKGAGGGVGGNGGVGDLHPSTPGSVGGPGDAGGSIATFRSPVGGASGIGGAGTAGGSDGSSVSGSGSGAATGKDRQGRCGKDAGSRALRGVQLTGLGTAANPPDLQVFFDTHATEQSSILSDTQFASLMLNMVPIREHMRGWSRRYALRRDGASLQALMLLCTGRGVLHGGDSLHPHAAGVRRGGDSFLILIEDSWGYVFGGYIACSMQNSGSYYGNGESFVFTVHPHSNSYRWSGRNDYFVLTNHSTIAMGGGENFAFQLDDELDTGVSGPCATFGSPQLSSNEYFKTLNVEVWTFEAGCSV